MVFFHLQLRYTCLTDFLTYDLFFVKDKNIRCIIQFSVVAGENTVQRQVCANDEKLSLKQRVPKVLFFDKIKISQNH